MYLLEIGSTGPIRSDDVQHQKGAGRSVLIALNGSQGSGKSMLCAYLDMAIEARHQLYILHGTRRIRGSQRREELVA